jgi:transcriptional regulator with XRE-family HTH domain
MQETTYKRLLGARILSEANDLKRTPAALASELGISREDLDCLLRGSGEPEKLYDVIDRMAQVYSIDGNDLKLLQDDCTNGVLIMRRQESEASSRFIERADASGKLYPYYEYRDTAYSRLSPFRPEWIRPLCNPDQTSVVFNNGHLLNQYTFYVGPINFYWSLNGDRYQSEMNTGDSTYGTPWWPHTFATREPNKQAYILAVTFGGDVRRAQRELYILGERTRQYVLEYRHHRRAMIQLLEHHLANEMLTRSEFVRQCKSKDPSLDAEKFFDETYSVSYAELCATARILNIEPGDLTLPAYDVSEEVIIRHRNQQDVVFYPDQEQLRYKVWPMARVSRLPQVKGFSIDVMSNELTLDNNLSSGLHSWIYNYGKSDVALIWDDGETTTSTVIEPHDSMYIQPFIRYAYANTGSEIGTLCEVRVPGTVNLATQRELSYMSEVGRVFCEDRVWF